MRLMKQDKSGCDAITSREDAGIRKGRYKKEGSRALLHVCRGGELGRRRRGMSVWATPPRPLLNTQSDVLAGLDAKQPKVVAGSISCLNEIIK